MWSSPFIPKCLSVDANTGAKSLQCNIWVTLRMVNGATVTPKIGMWKRSPMIATLVRFFQLQFHIDLIPWLGPAQSLLRRRLIRNCMRSCGFYTTFRETCTNKAGSCVQHVGYSPASLSLPNPWRPALTFLTRFTTISVTYLLTFCCIVVIPKEAVVDLAVVTLLLHLWCR